MQGTPLTRLTDVEAKLDVLEASLTSIEATVISEQTDTQTAIAAVQTEINDESLAGRNNETTEHTFTRLTITTKSDEEQVKLDGISAKLPLDPFYRLRVSEVYTIFDAKLINDKQPLFYDEVLNGTATATHNAGQASVSLTAPANGDYAIRQTKMRFNYQAGKGQLVLLTGVLGEPVANTEARIGYFNTSTTVPYTASRDGIYWGQDGSDNYVAISYNGTENKVIQSNWDDPLDGTGASGVTVDFDRVQIMGIDFEWLGVGTVRMFIFIDGAPVMVHSFHHANVTGQTQVYMSSPNHSVRYEVSSTGGSGAITQICSSVMSEGGIEPSGVTRTISNGVTAITGGTTLEGILFFRLNANRPCTTIDLAKFGILNTANNTSNYKYSVILNPTIGGTALSWTNITGSAIDYAPAQGNNTLTDGVVLDEGYTSGDSPNLTLPSNLIIRAGIDIDGTQDVFALAVQTFSGTDTFVGSMSLRELTCG